jgi:signal transduction histidine kinase
MKPRLDGIHLQILGLIILPFSIILLVIAVGGIRVHQNAMRQLVATRDERSVRAAAAAISEQLHHREAAVFGISLRLLDETSPSLALAQAEFLSSDFDGGLGILDQEGEVLASSISKELWINRPLGEVLGELQNGQTSFSEPYFESGNSMVLVAARNEDHIAIGAFSVAKLMRSTLLGAGSETSAYSAFLIDQTGKLLESEGLAPIEAELPGHQGVQAALRGEIGSSFLPAADGEHVVAFSPVQPTGWALILEEPWETVASPVLNLSLVAPLALVPALLLTLVALWFGARQVVRPIRQLQAQAEQLARAQYDAVQEPVRGIAEIQHLQRTMVWMAENVRQAQEALQGYIGAITEAQEEERQHLARELHDETIQDLIAIDQRIQLLRKDLGQNPEQIRFLDELRGEINLSIQELRRLIRGLRPIYLEDLGLVPAIEMLADDTKKELDIPVTFQIQGDQRRFKPGIELAIYRIVQEGLSNITRHAHPKKVSLTIEFNPHTFSTSIEDDGKGFTLPERPRDLAALGHFGLMGMHERAELIGGSLELASAPGTGTRIHIEVPYA